MILSCLNFPFRKLLRKVLGSICEIVSFSPWMYPLFGNSSRAVPPRCLQLEFNLNSTLKCASCRLHLNVWKFAVVRIGRRWTFRRRHRNRLNRQNSIDPVSKGSPAVFTVCRAIISVVEIIVVDRARKIEIQSYADRLRLGNASGVICKGTTRPR